MDRKSLFGSVNQKIKMAIVSISNELTSIYCLFFQDEICVDGIPTDIPNFELYRILTDLFRKAGPIKVI